MIPAKLKNATTRTTDRSCHCFLFKVGSAFCPWVYFLGGCTPSDPVNRRIGGVVNPQAECQTLTLATSGKHVAAATAEPLTFAIMGIATPKRRVTEKDQAARQMSEGGRRLSDIVRR